MILLLELLFILLLDKSERVKGFKVREMWSFWRQWSVKNPPAMTIHILNMLSLNLSVRGSSSAGHPGSSASLCLLHHCLWPFHYGRLCGASAQNWGGENTNITVPKTFSFIPTGKGCVSNVLKAKIGFIIWCFTFGCELARCPGPDCWVCSNPGRSAPHSCPASCLWDWELKLTAIWRS